MNSHFGFERLIPHLVASAILSSALSCACEDPTVPTVAVSAEVASLGQMVLELRAALQRPEAEESLETVVRHGTDSRNYAMIRGWLVQELRGVNSQLSGAGLPQETLGKHVVRRAFLERAIRRIDLE